MLTSLLVVAACVLVWLMRPVPVLFMCLLVVAVCVLARLLFFHLGRWALYSRPPGRDQSEGTVSSPPLSLELR